jgi:hypothetical protein
LNILCHILLDIVGDVRNIEFILNNLILAFAANLEGDIVGELDRRILFCETDSILAIWIILQVTAHKLLGYDRVILDELRSMRRNSQDRISRNSYAGRL